MNKIERRYVEQRFTVSDDESPKIRGYAAVFNSPSEDMGFVEKVDTHAFDDTLNADVRALWNHDANVVLGRTVSGTLRLSVDAKGLAYEIDPPDTQAARDLMVLMKRGDVNSSSFGFVTEEDKWDYNTNPATRTLLKVSLFDVSPVTYPAYAASTSEARSFPEGLPDSIAQFRAHQHTKKVDGDNLTADDFLYVGDPEKTETWSLPWKFSDEEKTKSHLRDALARFDQDKTIPADKKKAVHAKLVDLCKQYGIEVSEEQRDYDDPDVEDRCNCQCQACQDGDCANCSDLDCDCDGCTCNEERSLAHLKLQLDIARAF